MSVRSVMGQDYVSNSMDHDYMLFLEHIKEHGHSFIFEMVNKEDGSLTVLKYEDGDDQFDPLQSENGITLVCKSTENKKTFINDKNRKCEPSQGPQRFERFPNEHKKTVVNSSNSLDQKMDSSASPRVFSHKSTLNPGGELSSKNKRDPYLEDVDYLRHTSLSKKNDGKDNLDNDYMIFLKHLKECEQSFVLDMTDEENGVHVCVKYEDDVHSNKVVSKSDETVICKPAKRASCIGTQKWKPTSSILQVPDYNGNLTRKIKQTIGDSHPYPGLIDLSEADECCEAFLPKTRQSSDSYFPKLDTGISVINNDASIKGTGDVSSTIQHSDNESSSFSSQESRDTCKDVLASVDSDTWSKSLQFNFTEQLMATLDRPYDSNEYMKLYQEASRCKPVRHLRVLRGRSISYDTKNWISYFDQYPDLACQVKSASGSEALMLLRGFFFWLKHVSHEGSYKPWVPTPPLVLIPED